MSAEPFFNASPLVRTDFSDDAAWLQLIAKASATNEDGFFASLEPVEDRSFENADPQAIVTALSERKPSVIFIADARSFSSPEQTVLCVHRKGADTPFRCILSELWGVENNLSIANMGFDEFADSVDCDGVFRGFG